MRTPTVTDWLELVNTGYGATIGWMCRVIGHDVQGKPWGWRQSKRVFETPADDTSAS